MAQNGSGLCDREESRLHCSSQRGAGASTPVGKIARKTRGNRHSETTPEFSKFVRGAHRRPQIRGFAEGEIGRNCDFELKKGIWILSPGVHIGGGFRTYDLALKVSGHTAFFFLCILVAKVTVAKHIRDLFRCIYSFAITACQFGLF